MIKRWCARWSCAAKQIHRNEHSLLVVICYLYSALWNFLHSLPASLLTATSTSPTTSLLLLLPISIIMSHIVYEEASSHKVESIPFKFSNWDNHGNEPEEHKIYREAYNDKALAFMIASRDNKLPEATPKERRFKLGQTVVPLLRDQVQLDWYMDLYNDRDLENRRNGHPHYSLNAFLFAYARRFAPKPPKGYHGPDSTNLIKAQVEDPFCKEIIKLMATKIDNSVNIQVQFPCYINDNGILMHDTPEGKDVAVAPEAWHPHLLGAAFTINDNGPEGRNRMCQQISENFWWPTMSMDAAKFTYDFDIINLGDFTKKPGSFKTGPLCTVCPEPAMHNTDTCQRVKDLALCNRMSYEIKEKSNLASINTSAHDAKNAFLNNRLMESLTVVHASRARWLADYTVAEAVGNESTIPLFFNPKRAVSTLLEDKKTQGLGLGQIV